MTCLSLVPSKQPEGPAFFNFLIKAFTAQALNALSLTQDVDVWRKLRSVQVTPSLIYSMGTDIFFIV